jgi:hypothetical protein
MKRKHLWIAVAACCGTLAAGTLSTTALAATKTMPALTGWNLENAKTVNATEPDGRTWLYPDAATAIADVAGDGTGSRGFVIWELDDASGRTPGIQVRTDEPDYPLRNCIMASGERAGTVKKCGDLQDSSKRFKLRVTGSETEPVDLVFDVGSDDFTYDDTLNAGDITSRIYRVLMKWANFTNLRAQGFKVEVGFGTGDDFVPATGAEGVTFELSATVTRSSLGDAGGGADREVWKPLEFATFSPGQYSITGFFDNTVAGLIPPQIESPTLIYSGAAPSAWANGAITQNYFDRWGYMLNLALLPTGIYEDADGDPATEGSLKAFWDGANWRYGFADGFAVVPDAQLAAWGALPLSETQVLPGPRYEAAVIDDLGGLNVDVYLKLAETYDPTVNLAVDPADYNKITLRLTPVAPAVGIPGNEDLPAWLANPAPDIFAGAVPPPSGGGGGGGCAIGGDGRFDPTLPALAAAGLGFFGLRRFKASK